MSQITEFPIGTRLAGTAATRNIGAAADEIPTNEMILSQYGEGSGVWFDNADDLFAYNGPELDLGTIIKTKSECLTYEVVASSDTTPDWRDIGSTRIKPVYETEANDYYNRAYEVRKYRRAGRQILLADSLVSLTYGDSNANNNTAALQQLANRSTRRNEIIQFSSGVLRHESLSFPSDLYWEGPSDNPTVFKLRDGLSGADYSQVEILDDCNNGGLENLVFDGNRNNISITGNSEGLEYDSCEGWIHFYVTCNNSTADSYDHDRSGNHIFVFCTADDAGKDSFHNSGLSYRNWYLGCQASRTKGVRGSFTATEQGLGGNVFIDCIAAHSSKGFQIIEGVNGERNNTVINCVSVECTEYDEVSGIGIGIPPSTFNSNTQPRSFSIDLDNPPLFSGVFATGSGTTNAPAGQSSGTVIQSVTSSGTARQTFISPSGDTWSRSGLGSNVWVTPTSIGGAQTVNFDLNSPPLGALQVYIGASSANRPDNQTGMLTQVESGGGRIFQQFQTQSSNTIYYRNWSRTSTAPAWLSIVGT